MREYDMRIVFLGKGGAGKTTTAAGFIRFLLNHQKDVLAIDADINAHLKTALGFQNIESTHIGDHFDIIAKYVRGQRKDLGHRPMIGTTPPGVGSILVQPNSDDPLLQKIALFESHLTLLTVGGYSESDIGANCYHGKLGALNLLLNHLIDSDDDWIIADATAGTDTAATALFHAYDIQFFVVEPTLKSVSVFNDYLALAGNHIDHIRPIANKVRTSHVGRAEDLAFLRHHLDHEPVAEFPFDIDHIRAIDQGQFEKLDEYIVTHESQFERLIASVAGVKRDWSAMEKNALQFYNHSCHNWYNAYYDQDMVSGVGHGYRWGPQNLFSFNVE